MATLLPPRHTLPLLATTLPQPPTAHRWIRAAIARHESAACMHACMVIRAGARCTGRAVSGWSAGSRRSPVESPRTGVTALRALGYTADGRLRIASLNPVNTHTSTTNGRPGRYRSRSPRWGSRWECGGSRFVPVAPPECVAAVAAPEGVGGLGAGGGATAGGAVATAELGTAAALAAAGTAAEASPGATGAECLAAAASPGVGGAAEAEWTGG